MKLFKKVLTFSELKYKIIYVVTQGYTLQAQIAQLVEQRTENPRVTGSIPVLGILYCSCGIKRLKLSLLVLFFCAESCYNIHMYANIEDILLTEKVL